MIRMGGEAGGGPSDMSKARTNASVMKYDVFISYSSVDRKFAEGICGYLESQGLRCFIDYRDIPRGALWARVIPNALEDSGMMVAIFSDNYNNSMQVERELSVADKLGLPILPFRLNDIPFKGMKLYYFESINWIDAFPEPEKVFGSLLDSIMLMREQSDGWTKDRKNHEVHTKDVSESMDSAVCHIDDNNIDLRWEDDYQEGLDAVRNFEYADAFDYLLEPAMNNYRRAQYYMDRLFNDWNVFRLPRSIWPRIRQYANGGNAYAEYLLGMYFYGRIEPDNDLAYEYCVRSELQGNMFGIYAMARNFDLGTCTERDEKAAVEKYKALERLDFPLAMARLGMYYVYGYGVRKNIRRGIKILQRGVDMGIIDCIYMLAEMKVGKDIVSKDVEGARQMYRQCIADGYSVALDSLAATYYFDYEHGTTSTGDTLREGIRLLNDGVRKGDARCMSSLAFAYNQETENMGLKYDPAASLRWYRKAAERGDRNAMVRLGDMYYYGNNGLSEDNAEAWRWYKKAAALNYNEGYYRLGMVCKDGFGQEGKTIADCIDYFEDSLFVGGYYGGCAAEELYGIYVPDGFDADFPYIHVKPLRIDGVEPDESKVLEVLRVGADCEHRGCQYLLGCAMTTPGKSYTDEVEGVALLEKALNTSMLPFYGAALRLGELYAKGIGVPRDEEKAAEYMALGRENINADEIRTVESRSEASNGTRSETRSEPGPAPTAAPAAKAAFDRGCELMDSRIVANYPDALYQLNRAVKLGYGDAAERQYERSLTHVRAIADGKIQSESADAVLAARLCFVPNTPERFSSEGLVRARQSDFWTSLKNDWKTLQDELGQMKLPGLPPLSDSPIDNAAELIRLWREIRKLDIPVVKEGVSVANTPLYSSKALIDAVEQVSDEAIQSVLLSIITVYLDIDDVLRVASVY